MVPIDEGNEECMKCKKLDMCHGCIDTYADNWRDRLPSCGRNINISQRELKEIIEKESKQNGKRRFFKTLQENCSRLFQ